MKSLLQQSLNGHYFIVRQLRHRSSYISYLAEDRYESRQSQCLVKQYQLLSTRDSNDIRSSIDLKSYLFQEIIRIRHANRHFQVPPILDYFLWGKELYIIREFITGSSLEEQIEGRTLTESEVKLFFQKTLVVLDKMHQSQMMHLNLKPSNIILTAEEKEIFITDSHCLADSLAGKVLKSKIIEDISPEEEYYLAPEQKRGKPEISSDFYALAAIAIKALTGKFIHQINFTNLDGYARASLVDIETKQSTHISSQLARILHNLIDKNPSKRYQSASDILHDLSESENVIVLPSPINITASDREQASFLTTKGKYQGGREYKSVTSDKQHNNQNNKRKLLILFLTVSSIAFCSAFAYTFLKQKTRLKQNFVTYANPNYNISFQYPERWIATELEDSIIGKNVILTSPLEDISDYFQEQIYISIDELDTSLEQYKQDTLTKLENASGITIVNSRQESFKLANRPTQSITYRREQDGILLQQKEVFAIENGKVYLITYIAEGKKYPKYLTVLDKVIESLAIAE